MNDLIFFWKPSNIPTTFGLKDSFLEKIKNKLNMQEHKEFGLLNRLDNDTCGLLYFASNQKVYDQYKNDQKIWKIKKIYYAQVYWNVRPIFFEINFPIAHHKFDKSKMVCGIYDNWKIFDKNLKQIHFHWKLHFVSTFCEKEFFDTKTNTTILKVTITKWIRHQIRCHLWFWWNAIVNDAIYTPKKFQKKVSKNINNSKLWLTSAGLIW